MVDNAACLCLALHQWNILYLHIGDFSTKFLILGTRHTIFKSRVKYGNKNLSNSILVYFFSKMYFGRNMLLIMILAIKQMCLKAFVLGRTLENVLISCWLTLGRSWFLAPRWPHYQSWGGEVWSARSFISASPDQCWGSGCCWIAF